MCRDCSDISSIELADPVEILDHPDSGLRYPRGFGAGSALFFTLLAAGGSELWFTEDPDAEPSFRLGDAGLPARSGLVPLSHGGATTDVVFDAVMDGRRTARSALFDGATLTNDAALGSPLSPGGFYTYSLAVARETNRYYWMSTRDGPVELRTGVLGTGNEDVVMLEVPSRSAATACPREGDDATPWVSTSGELMLFSAAPMDDQCAAIDGGATDLYAALLSPASGMPLAAAVALTAVNRTLDASTQTDPSFTPDLCRLYFATDGGQAGGHDFRLFRADRR
jgi:hypothetical protein